MNVTLRFRAYPDKDTVSEAWRHIDIHRQIRNQAIRDYYRSPRDDRPGKNQQVNKLSGWKGFVRKVRFWREIAMKNASIES